MSSRIKLPKRLKSFQESNTASPSKGFIPKGTYPILEYLENHPNNDTDYVHIQSPELGDVWICSRWKDQSYAELLPDQLTFEGADAIDESAILENLPAYNGSTYSLKQPRYPFELKGIGLKQSPPRLSNCCTFVEGILIKSWQDVFPEFEWSKEQHANMMIMSKEDLYSPITEAVKSDLAVELDEDTPNPWTIIQGWNDKMNRGHTFIIVDHDPTSDKVLTLESNASFKLNGVGFRGLGNSEMFDNEVPSDWSSTPGVPTWAALKKRYPNRKMAALKVKNLKWASQEVLV